jgi:cytochrome c peroxidase
MKLQNTFLFSIVVFSLLWACKPEDVKPEERIPHLPAEVYRYYDTVAVQDLFFDPYNDSVINDHIATLGRVLFYDTRLSRNNRVSCGTCHRQTTGFSDNFVHSPGFEFLPAGRNTQAIVNTGTQVGFFWDLREQLLDHMVLQPIANHIEMGIDEEEYMIAKVENAEYYKPLFQNAFGTEEVTAQRMGIAMAQFVRSIISYRTKYDAGRSQVNTNLDPFPNFTEEENLGRQLFFTKFPCSTCHGGPNLDGSLTFAQNIGLEEHYSDPGVIGIFEGDVPLNGWFKTPSLRNITLTGPYMHDGRFGTLEEVVEFYNSGIQYHPQLSQTLRTHDNGGLFNLGPSIPPEYQVIRNGTIPLRMFMTNAEKNALVAFLRTLTDYELLHDPKFSDPFIDHGNN